jgi:hypothetical protein
MDTKYIKTDSEEYKDVYNSGLTEGYQIGYDVAQTEYQAFYDSYMNIKEDFYTFKDELIARFDEKYANKTESFILRVGVLHHHIRPYILDDETTVGNIKRLQEDDYEFIHFIKTVTELYLDGDISTANKDALGILKAYCKLGQCLLGSEDFYRIDFDEYQFKIMQMEWERN